MIWWYIVCFLLGVFTAVPLFALVTMNKFDEYFSRGYVQGLKDSAFTEEGGSND